MRIYISIILVCIFCMQANAQDIDTAVKAKAAVLMDCGSGRILWERNSTSPLAMASTTKIMTAIITLEYCDTDEIVTVSKRAASAPPVKMNLEEGENIRLMDLLYALMLQSSNDSAVAIAEHVSGSVESFCSVMTEKAKKLGCTDTVFETPNGLDTDNHHSTAEDMAVIARYALENDDFVKLITTKQVSFKSDKKSYDVVNKNRLLSEYSGAIGVKTGYTGKAGHCFVGAAERDGMKLVCVCLASGWGQKGKQQKWIDAKALLNYGFDNYRYYTIIDKTTQTGTVSIERGNKESAETYLAQGLCMPLTKEEKESLRLEYNINKTLAAPVKKGQKCGECTAYIGEEQIGSADICVSDDVEKQDFYYTVKKMLEAWFSAYNKIFG